MLTTLVPSVGNGRTSNGINLGGLWWTPGRGPVSEGGNIGHQPSLTLKCGLFPNQLLQPPVQGLYQKSPLWSVEMI